VLAKAGIPVSKLKSNYKYDPKIERNPLKKFDEGGREVGIEERSARDQIDSYNSQLEEAAQGIEEVKTRVPNIPFQSEEVLSYQLEPEKNSVLEINTPPPAALEEYGNVEIPAATPPRNYQELLEQAAKE